MANPCGKTRPAHDPYEVWQSLDGTWTWNVLKKYQSPENEAKNPYARWLCQVITPYTTEHGDWGDVYVRDITSHARRIK
jgi:hypothetical protein